MSNDSTEKWLESREEDFLQALSEGHMDIAQEINDDVRNNGFDVDAWAGFSGKEAELIIESNRQINEDKFN